MTTMRELMEAVQRDNWVILDTETTGLERPAEVCQVAIVDKNGTALLDTLIKPVGSISAGAYRVHGITDLHVQDAPNWPTVREAVLAHISGRDVIVYNATFDRKIMHWSDEASNLGHFDYKERSTWLCAMLAYAEFWGAKHPYYGSYVWQKLQTACEQQGILASDQHTAIGDCYATFQLVRHIAQVYKDKLSWRQLTGRDEDTGEKLRP